MSAVLADPRVAELTERVVQGLGGHVYAVRGEKRVQDRIAGALSAAGLVFEREFRLSGRDRPDFFVEGRVVIEVKLKTPRAQVLRQLGRYAEDGRVAAIVLASTSFATLQGMRLTIHDVPVYPVVLRGSGLLG